ncbi:hypothetical protein GKZ68_02385 [Hymenobacter sp. BRD128]|uniref:hypothetical protein n=1 Tax=Hymenobacter sp. BRD128 TaxID=2675878 RepID=UPI001566C9DB|nr:hypothetical protein [Hymenobacter sp. BRD128]QKG55584.1 hypothetical protein GKZ68_02385 [Hymenobacter sp. BRD128]
MVATAPTLYYRFQGVPDLYASPNPSEALRRKVAELASQPDAKQADIYVNNDTSGSAIGNAQGIRRPTDGS